MQDIANLIADQGVVIGKLIKPNRGNFNFKIVYMENSR